MANNDGEDQDIETAEAKASSATDVTRFLEPSGIESYDSRPLDVSRFLARADTPRAGSGSGAAATTSAVAALGGDLVIKHDLPPRIALGGPLAVGVQLTYQGKSVPAKDPRVKSIKTTIQSKDHFGPFVYVVISSFGKERKIGVKTTVEFQPDKKTTLPPVTKSTTVEVFCARVTSGLDPTHRLVACMIYSEGGSRSDFNEAELLAVGWCARNRVQVVLAEVGRWVVAAKSNLEAANRRWDLGVGGWLKGRSKSPATRSVLAAMANDPAAQRQFAFRSVLHRAHFNGVPDGDPEEASFAMFHEFLKCWDPPRFVDYARDCSLIPRALDIASDVLAGRQPDPYAGQGPREPKGIFYYQTLRTRRTNPIGSIGPQLADLSTLPADSPARLDHHVHFAIDPSFPAMP